MGKDSMEMFSSFFRLLINVVYGLNTVCCIVIKKIKFFSIELNESEE